MGKPNLIFFHIVQTGSGTEPIYYWLDGEGRPLLFTDGLASCALTAIEQA